MIGQVVVVVVVCACLGGVQAPQGLCGIRVGQAGRSRLPATRTSGDGRMPALIGAQIVFIDQINNITTVGFVSHIKHTFHTNMICLFSFS